MYTGQSAQKPSSYPFSLPSDLAFHPRNTKCQKALTLPASLAPRVWTGSSILANRSWEVCEGRQFWDRMFSSLIKEECMQRGISVLPPRLHRWSCKGWCCCRHHYSGGKNQDNHREPAQILAREHPGCLGTSTNKQTKTSVNFYLDVDSQPKTSKKCLAKNEPERGWIISKLYN